jgi:transcriptional regulator with XRE-family HTH domain
MNPPPIQSQVKIDLNKNIFNKIRVKSNYTVVSETFGQWLIRQRRTLGLNQSEFAKRAGLTKATLSLYEKDSVAQPRFRQLDKIARALGKPPDEVRRAASPAATDESYDILEGAIIMFQNESDLTPEQKAKLIDMARTIAQGIINEHGKE